MLDFKLSISKSDLYPKETARIAFALNNTSNKVIHCLSYKFKTFWRDKVVDDFSPHEFFFNLQPFETKEREFGEVNISEAYLAGNSAAAEHIMKVWIRYFICGEDEIQEVSDQITINLMEEVDA